MGIVLICAVKNSDDVIKVICSSHASVPGIYFDHLPQNAKNFETIFIQHLNETVFSGITFKPFYYELFQDVISLDLAKAWNPAFDEAIHFRLMLVEAYSENLFSLKILNPNSGFDLKTLPDLLKELPPTRVRLPYLRALQALSGGFDLKLDAILEPESEI